MAFGQERIIQGGCPSHSVHQYGKDSEQVQMLPEILSGLFFVLLYNLEMMTLDHTLDVS